MLRGTLPMAYIGSSRLDGALGYVTQFALLRSVIIGGVYICGVTERGSSEVECRTRNQVSPGSNPPLLPFRRLGVFVLSIDAPVDSAV